MIEKLTDNQSFSGHTSVSAVSCFIAAQMFEDYYQIVNFQIFWLLAGTIPAVTGYIRIKAGKHFLMSW